MEVRYFYVPGSWYWVVKCSHCLHFNETYPIHFSPKMTKHMTGSILCEKCSNFTKVKGNVIGGFRQDVRTEYIPRYRTSIIWPRYTD